MRPSIQESSRSGANRRGFALPLALLGLLAVSVLITSLLLTASTEVSLSSAHQDATISLHTAEGGIESYVTQTYIDLAPAEDLLYTPPDRPAAEAVRLDIARLSRLPNGNSAWPDDEVFAITAEPAQGGGRTVSALAHLTSAVLDIGDLSAIWSGSDLDVRGNTTISDGSDSVLCTDQPAAENALEYSSEVEADLGNNVSLVGDSATSLFRPSRFVEATFGTTLPGLIAMADVEFGQGAFGTENVTSDESRADPLDSQATPYNWGCPEDMVLDPACVLDGDQDYYPLVAIDASNDDGSWGSVTVNLEHGQGMLVVYNGNLRLQGNLIFKGVILVEGAFDVHASGGGANTPKIEGALIGLGMGPGGAESVVDQDIQGAPVIRYNGCAIQEIRDEFEEDNKFVRVVRPTYGWFEVVR